VAEYDDLEMGVLNTGSKLVVLIVTTVGEQQIIGLFLINEHICGKSSFLSRCSNDVQFSGCLHT